MAIKIVEVNEKETPASLGKKVRSCAMTGGVEIVLAAGLEVGALEQIVINFEAEIVRYPASDMRRQSSNAYRVLKQVREHPKASPELQERVQEAFNKK